MEVQKCPLSRYSFASRFLRGVSSVPASPLTFFLQGSRVALLRAWPPRIRIVPDAPILPFQTKSVEPFTHIFAGRPGTAEPFPVLPVTTKVSYQILLPLVGSVWGLETLQESWFRFLRLHQAKSAAHMCFLRKSGTSPSCSAFLNDMSVSTWWGPPVSVSERETKRKLAADQQNSQPHVWSGYVFF